MTAAPPVRITGPASLIAAVPYLLGFEPTDSLVLIGLHDRQVTVTARVDLDDLDHPQAAADLMSVLATKAQSTDVVAVTYGHRTETDTIAATAAASGMRLLEHVRVADGRYWSLTCPIEGCCPADGRPLATDNAVAAEFVALGASKARSREDLDAMFSPVPDTDRFAPLIHAAEQAALDQRFAGRQAARVTSDKRALFAASRRTDRRWSDAETARYAAALAGYEIRDALWLAIEDGHFDGRDLFLYLARTLPESHRAPALFLFGWKSWREGNGALASMAVDRALHADPGYAAATLLQAALTQGIDPRRMPRLRLAG
jgi:Domain of unknown function (DUF4192)